MVAPVTLLRLVYLRCFLLRTPPLVRFHGRRPAEINPNLRRRRRRERPSLSRPPAVERDFAAGSEPMDARRAAAGPGARRTGDRPSLRFPLYRPRGQGVFPRSRPREQRTPARPGGPHRRHRRQAGRAWIGLPTPWDDSPRGTASISSWATTIVAPATSAEFAARWSRAGWSISAAGSGRSRSAAIRCCWPATSGRGSTSGAEFLSAREDRHSCLPQEGRQECLPRADADALRIALAHCPDQLRWARAWGADLMLAGHTHGGQIRIPPLGAIFSPTRHGVKYVSGVFYSPPTILHVSRGVSGDIPIRWNCPPEIACLRLRSSRRA